MEDINLSRRTPKDTKHDDSTRIEIDREFFVRVSTPRYLAILIGFAMFGFLCFHPFPEVHLKTMGGPGERLQYLRDNYHTQLKIGFFVSVLLHLGEALYGIKIATKLNLTQETINKWTVQTFLLGYASLYELIKYSEKVDSAKRK